MTDIGIIATSCVAIAIALIGAWTNTRNTRIHHEQRVKEIEVQNKIEMRNLRNLKMRDSIISMVTVHNVRDRIWYRYLERILVTNKHSTLDMQSRKILVGDFESEIKENTDDREISRTAVIFEYYWKSVYPEIHNEFKVLLDDYVPFIETFQELNKLMKARSVYIIHIIDRTNLLIDKLEQMDKRFDDILRHGYDVLDN